MLNATLDRLDMNKQDMQSADWLLKFMILMLGTFKANQSMHEKPSCATKKRTQRADTDCYKTLSLLSYIL